MAVASDLPRASRRCRRSRRRKNSVHVRRPGPQARDPDVQRGPDPRQARGHQPDDPQDAVIAIEDRRFYTNAGVDLRGIGARAVAGHRRRARPCRAARRSPSSSSRTRSRRRHERTLLNKLREAAMAYHMTRKWSKEKILTEYLNTIYFGNGAYGIEAAARTYFGEDVNHRGLRRDAASACARASCSPTRRRCWRASSRRPSRATTRSLTRTRPSAGATSSWTRWSRRARSRRRCATRRSTRSLPAADDVRPPQLQSRPGGAVLHLLGAPAARRRVRRAAGVRGRPAGHDDAGPRPPEARAGRRCSATCADRRRARPPRWWRSTTPPARSARWSAARDYATAPFNLATQGQRQPGSAFKPFILAEALRRGLGPGVGVALAQARVHGAGHARAREVRRQQLRGPLLGRDARSATR